MMLVECVALHEPALKASFWAVYRMPYDALDPVDAADLTAWLPAGCALWRAVGGPMSLTQEVHELRGIDYRLQVLAWMKTEDAQKKRNQPKPPAPVPYAGEERLEEDHARRQFAARSRRGAD